MSTHTLPLSYLVQALREFVPRVVLIGIQPQWVAFGYPVSAEVKTAVDKVYDDLTRGVGHWASLSPCGERA
jgi:hydrogenase 3 maturation protease